MKTILLKPIWGTGGGLGQWLVPVNFLIEFAANSGNLLDYPH